jgi:hypothetical protein
MLACVNAANSPARPCPFDGNRTICPEHWEIRNLYVVEAAPKPMTITAGELRKTLVIFSAYRDRPIPDAKVAIFPFKRVFQIAMVDEDVQDGFSTAQYTPSPTAADRECWYLNMGAVTRQFFDPETMAKNSH